MKNFKLLSLAVISYALLVQNVFAADFAPTWDIAGGSTAAFMHTTTNGNQGSHTWSIYGTFNYFLLPQIEVGLGVNAYLSHSGGFTNSTLQLLAGPTYDFSTDVANSIFLQGSLGATWSASSNDFAYGNNMYRQFTWLVGLGKRFEIAKHVTWTPEVTWYGVKGVTDQTGSFQPTVTNINVIPFQLSVLF